MRRLTIFLLLILSLLAKAQPWTPVDEHRYNDETIVYAELWSHGFGVSDGSFNYIVGAFIDGECRAIANTSYINRTILYTLRVVGDRDTDRNILVSAKNLN